jgi:hypothetical protein
MEMDARCTNGGGCQAEQSAHVNMDSATDTQCRLQMMALNKGLPSNWEARQIGGRIYYVE